jgi:cell wall-associated NlpC family hydrolase
MKILERYGVELPHSSNAQSDMGMPVEYEQAKPGDLVFYDHGSGTVNHVAMYIGNGQIVHASNSRDGIKISDIYYSNPVCIKRFIQ